MRFMRYSFVRSIVGAVLAVALFGPSSSAAQNIQKLQFGGTGSDLSSCTTGYVYAADSGNGTQCVAPVVDTNCNDATVCLFAGSASEGGPATSALTATNADNLTLDPAPCAANQFVTDVDRQADLTCAAITDADVPNDITVDLAAAATSVNAATNADAAFKSVPFLSAATGTVDVQTDTDFTFRPFDRRLLVGDGETEGSVSTRWYNGTFYNIRTTGVGGGSIVLNTDEDGVDDVALTVRMEGGSRILTLPGDATISGSNTGDQTNIAGNAATADHVYLSSGLDDAGGYVVISDESNGYANAGTNSTLRYNTVTEKLETGALGVNGNTYSGSYTVGGGGFTGALNGNATTATSSGSVTIASPSTDTTSHVLISDSAGTGSAQTPRTDTGITYDASNNLLAADYVGNNTNMVYKSSMSASLGTNNDVSLPTTGFAIISGPGGAFTITGIVAPAPAIKNGYTLAINNKTIATMSLSHGSGSSSAANRIYTANWGTRSILKGGSVILRYDTNIAYGIGGWVVIAEAT